MLLMLRPRKFTPEVLNAALVGLEAQKDRIDARIAEVRSMLPGQLANPAATPDATPRKRRKFSAATRRKMKAAQQARWAKIRGESEPAKVAAKPKRKMSAAGRKAIIAATKKRWARVRAEAAQATPKKIAKKKVAVKKAAPAKAAKKKAVKKAAVKKTAPVAVSEPTAEVSK